MTGNVPGTMSSMTPPSDDPKEPMPTARGQRAEQALHAAVLELLDENGFSNLSVDKIAARARVGKPTIYRRWANKEELIAHVLGHIDPPEPVAYADALEPALIGILTNLQRRFTDTRTGRIWQRLIGEADGYPGVIDKYNEQFIRPRRQAIGALLRHHIDTGELRADLDVDAAVELIVAGMLGTMLLLPQSGTGASPETVVHLLLDGMRR